MLDAVRGYAQIASGLTEVTTKKALEVVRALQPGAVDAGAIGDRVQGLADDLVATSRQNRELLVGLVRTEVDRAVGRMGFVREEELAAVRRHVQRLETQIAALRDERTPEPARTPPRSRSRAASGSQPSRTKPAGSAAKPAGSAAKPAGGGS